MGENGDVGPHLPTSLIAKHFRRTTGTKRNFSQIHVATVLDKGEDGYSKALAPSGLSKASKPVTAKQLYGHVLLV